MSGGELCLLQLEVDNIELMRDKLMENDICADLIMGTNGKLNDFEVPKGEGVSRLIRKKDWDHIGGNDPLFAPASWEDMDLFLRMLNEGYRFILPSKSLIWHFGARGSHRLEENDGKSSERQIKAEQANQIKWLKKWGRLPKFNEVGFICGLE